MSTQPVISAQPSTSSRTHTPAPATAQRPERKAPTASSEVDQLVFGLDQALGIAASAASVTPASAPAATPAANPHFIPSPGEIGFAERFEDQWGELSRYDCNRGLWLLWRGTHWAIDDTGEAIERMKRVAAHILDSEVPACRLAVQQPGDYHDLRARELTREGQRLHNKATLHAALSLAQSIPTLVTRTRDYDRDGLLLNTPSDTIDLRTGQARPHDAADYITQIGKTPLAPEGQDCPRWKQFLNEVMCGDTVMVDYLQRVLGYCLTGDTSEQCFFMLHGVGANGKSTFLKVVQHILGDYAMTTDFNTFLDLNRGAAPRNDLADMVGKRLVVAIEGSEGKKLDDAVIKQFCGGDTVTARHLHKEFFQFDPVCKIMLATNCKPKVQGTDEGIWRRVRLIPFLAKFPPEQRDNKLFEKLQQEAPAILRWMLEGCALWQAHGLDTPKVVQEATQDYRTALDVFQFFLDDCTESRKDERVSSQALYDTYTQWCGANGILVPMKQADFNIKLQERGFTRVKSSGRMLWNHLRLARPTFSAHTPVQAQAQTPAHTPALHTTATVAKMATTVTVTTTAAQTTATAGAAAPMDNELCDGDLCFTE
jgi:putative DNA primase/helicase